MPLRQRKLWRLSLSLLGCMLLLAIAEGRPWTSSDGKTVDAEFVEFSAEGEGVVLDINGRRFTVPLDRLSESDRAYLAEIKASQGSNPQGSDDDMANDDLSSDLREPRVWTARDGTTVQARLIRISSGTVLLREADRSHRVRFYDLSLADRRFLSQAFAAMGQGNEVPPVRPELVDLVVEPAEPAPMPPPGDGANPVPQTSGQDTPTTAQQGDISLPPSGFGSLETDGSAEPVNELPKAAQPGEDIVLPPSGFGSLDQDAPGAAPAPNSPPVAEGFGADVVLPPSGFGSSPESTDESADAFFSEAGNPTQDGHVKIPQSTIDGRERLPATGFGAAPAEVAMGEREQPLIPKPPASPADIAGTSAQVQSPARTQSRPPSGSQSYTPKPNLPPTPLTAAPAELTGAQWNLRFFGILLLSGGAFLSSASYLWLIASAFYESFREGLRWLVPGTAVLVTLTDSEQSNTPLMTMMLGICLAMGGCGLLLS